MPSRLRPILSPISIELDGESLPADEGEPLAASLLAAGQSLFARSAKYHRPRGPYCFTGTCTNCLMRVDGVPNVATCRVAARSGMRLERQNALPDARLDVLRAADFVFRRWFNHHTFLAGVPIAEPVFRKLARQMAGLGYLPDTSVDREPARVEHHDVAIIGAGVAGFAASQRLSELGVAHVVLERESRTAHNSPSLRLGSEVIGLYSDQGTPFLAVVEAQRLTLLFVKRLLLACGGHPFLPSFPNNDLPGIMAGRAVSGLILRHGILPGKLIACVGELAEAHELAEHVRQAGGIPIAVGAEVVRAHGNRRVEAVSFRPPGAASAAGPEATQKLPCDILAVCLPPAPSFELARAGGARTAWDSASRHFVVEAGPRGETAAPWLFAAGELCGPMSRETAALQGRQAADALSEGLS
jgi:sarcosine oxidase subunit alpha